MQQETDSTITTKIQCGGAMSLAQWENWTLMDILNDAYHICYHQQLVYQTLRRVVSGGQQAKGPSTHFDCWANRLVRSVGPTIQRRVDGLLKFH